jgi:hypothetical protein
MMTYMDTMAKTILSSELVRFSKGVKKEASRIRGEES